jgi:hypothetical protein
MRTKILSLCAILTVGLVACQKTDDGFTPFDDALTLKSTEISLSDIQIESVADESQFEAEFFSNSEMMLRGIIRGGGSFKNYFKLNGGMRYQMGQCPDVEIDTAEAGYPITLTLNYGESTVLHNGKVLSGTMVIEISGPKFTDGTTRTITYSGFSVDTITVEGIISDQFTGNNVDSRQITVTSNLTFTFPDGTFVNREGVRVHTWVEGLETEMEFDDDKIEITGTISATNSAGETYSKEIVEPIIKLGSCNYYVQGIAQITFNAEVISSVDFGDGECDNEATLTVGDEISTILLKEGKQKEGSKSKQHGRKNTKRGNGNN